MSLTSTNNAVQVSRDGLGPDLSVSSITKPNGTAVKCISYPKGSWCCKPQALRDSEAPGSIPFLSSDISLSPTAMASHGTKVDNPTFTRGSMRESMAHDTLVLFPQSEVTWKESRDMKHSALNLDGLRTTLQRYGRIEANKLSCIVLRDLQAQKAYGDSVRTKVDLVFKGDNPFTAEPKRELDALCPKLFNFPGPSVFNDAS